MEGSLHTLFSVEMTYDKGLVFEVRRSWVSNYVGRDRRGTYLVASEP